MTAERPVEKSSAVADVGADRLTDLFWQAEKLPSIGEWRVRFETTVRTLMRVRSLPRPEAEKAAYQNVLVEFLNDEIPTLADPNSCFWCRRPEEPGAVLIPLGVGRRTAWLHRECGEKWRVHRRANAIAKLTEMGVVRP